MLMLLLSWLLLLLLLKVRASPFRASGCCCTPGFLLVLQMRLRPWLLLMLLSWLLPMLLLKVRLWASPFVPLVAAALRVSWCCRFGSCSGSGCG